VDSTLNAGNCEDRHVVTAPTRVERHQHTNNNYPKRPTGYPTGTQVSGCARNVTTVCFKSRVLAQLDDQRDFIVTTEFTPEPWSTYWLRGLSKTSSFLFVSRNEPSERFHVMRAHNTIVLSVTSQVWSIVHGARAQRISRGETAAIERTLLGRNDLRSDRGRRYPWPRRFPRGIVAHNVYGSSATRPTGVRRRCLLLTRPVGRVFVVGRKAFERVVFARPLKLHAKIRVFHVRYVRIHVHSLRF